MHSSAYCLPYVSLFSAVTSYYAVALSFFLTTKISSPFLASHDQSSLSPFSRHCLTILMGIVVRSDANLGEFFARVVSSPKPDAIS